MMGAYEGRQRPPLDASHRWKALWLGWVGGRWGPELGDMGATIAAALEWRYPAGAAWFVRAPCFGPRERQHPHT